MTARDDLAKVIWGVEADEIGTFKTGVTSKAADDIADAILAAGWRPPTPPAHAIEPRNPRIVTTPSELMSLPVGSVVLSETYGTPKMPVALQKHHGALWIPIGRSSDTHSSFILPATVLHIGGAK